MDIVELKKLLKIPQDNTTNDDYFAEALPAAIEFVQAHCRDEFKDDLGNVVLPTSVKMAVAKLVKFWMKDNDVQSKGIGDLSVSYFTDDIPKGILSTLRPYRKVRFV